MTLNIINYNYEFENDIETIKELENILDVLKNNINTKYYLPYKNFLKKINKFIDMMINPFEKELEELKKKTELEETTDNDDNISVGSISEYEDNDTCDNEVKQIKQFEKLLDCKMSLIKNRFEFDYSKTYEI